MSSDPIEVLRELRQNYGSSWPSSKAGVAALDAALASLSAPKPDGEWVLVPREPPQMALDYLAVPELGNWHGMLALMPVPPKPESAEAVAWIDSEGQVWASMDEVPSHCLPPGRTFRPLVYGDTAPPRPEASAPVGVESLVADLETIWHSVSDDKETNAAYQRLKAALAGQQQGGPQE